MKSNFVYILVVLCLFSCSHNKHDLLIVNGMVYSGLGDAPFRADIAIDNDKISAIGNLEDHTADTVIDASNMAVSPGFIDVHTHLDPILRMPDAESHVRQGVTLALGGPDGSSPWPLNQHLDSLKKLPLGMNIAYLIGHNTLRKEVMGMDNRPPTQNELEQMKKLVSQGMNQGAFGFSTGLKYLPGAFSKVDEVIALSKEASAKGGIYTSHLREEGLGLLEAVEEAIQISEKAEIPVVLTHHKAIGKPMWGKSAQTLAKVDSARAKDLDIMLDQYPYIASYTSISVLIPAWARAGGKQEFEKRLSDPKLKDSITSGIVFNILNDRGGGDLDRILLAKVDWNTDLEGKTLKHWVTSEGHEPTPEIGAEFVLKAQLNGGASCVYFAMNDIDVNRIMQHPMTMIASDGRLTKPGIGHPHPRWYGTFPRVLGHYVREKKLISLEEAIRKMTSLPAMRLGLNKRGVLKKGAFADITVFDPKIVTDQATFTEPHQYPIGIEYVLVNGKITVENGEMTQHRSGKVLYGKAKK